MTDEAVVQVKALALELGVEPEVVERELGDGVFRHGGFRVCSAAKAAALIEQHEARRLEAEDRAKESAKRKARAAEEARARRAASQARGQRLRASAARGETRVVEMQVAESTPVRGLDDLPDACALARMGSAAEYLGGTVTARPSALDWTLGRGEGGGVFGPSPEDRDRQRAARRLNRAAKKGGPK
jgi:hypothetical protein